MPAERFKRRFKRGVLELIARVGYDVHKDPDSFPPYRLLKRLDLGKDSFSDIRRIRGNDLRCVFDVGAHVGQTTARLMDAFPKAHVYSFEPDVESYSQLRRLADSSNRVTAVNAAVGDVDGQETFFVNKQSQTNSLLKTLAGTQQYLVSGDSMDLRAQTTVAVVTLDRFCADHGIDRIDLLKLDTQGYEIRALEGARDVLKRLAVPFICLEVCFVRTYEHQPLFSEVYEYLFDRGYRLVWMYETGFHTHFYSVGANALFIDERIGTRIYTGSAPG